MIRTFRHPIELVYLQPTEDGIGNQTILEKPYYRCRANVNGIGGKEYFAAAQPIEEGEVTFEVRYCKKLAKLNTTEYGVRFRGELYDLTYLDNYQFGNEALKMRAKKREVGIHENPGG